MLRIGVVGYGTGGQHFHTPFIAAAQGCALAGIVARAEATIAKARADWPDVPVFPSLTAMIDAGVCDAVTVTTPPQTRRALVLEAIGAGLHVVADKPFAPNYQSGMELDAAAKKRGVRLGVYQNRRFDADLQTLKKVIDDGHLGTIWRIHSRMDQDSPQTLEAGPSGGLLRDLGSHVVDQMVFLLGAVVSVDAQLDILDWVEGPTDVGFTLALRHEGGAHSQLGGTKGRFVPGVVIGHADPIPVGVRDRSAAIGGVTDRKRARPHEGRHFQLEPEAAIPLPQLRASFISIAQAFQTESFKEL